MITIQVTDHIKFDSGTMMRDEKLMDESLIHEYKSEIVPSIGDLIIVNKEGYKVVNRIITPDYDIVVVLVERDIKHG